MTELSRPLESFHGGGSRGWRRHIRRWKSAHTLAKTGNKAARNWLAKRGKAVPAHPNDRRPPPEPRLEWSLLRLGYSTQNWCPECYGTANPEARLTDQGRRTVLICRSCSLVFRPR